MSWKIYGFFYYHTRKVTKLETLHNASFIQEKAMSICEILTDMKPLFSMKEIEI